MRALTTADDETTISTETYVDGSHSRIVDRLIEIGEPIIDLGCGSGELVWGEYPLSQMGPHCDYLKKTLSKYYGGCDESKTSITVRCPVDECERSRRGHSTVVIGTGVYKDESSICMAWRHHSGKTGGIFTVHFAYQDYNGTCQERRSDIGDDDEEGKCNYVGSTQNGVKSLACDTLEGQKRVMYFKSYTKTFKTELLNKGPTAFNAVQYSTKAKYNGPSPVESGAIICFGTDMNTTSAWGELEARSKMINCGGPTPSPTKAPTLAPTKAPTLSPTKAPTLSPTKAPTLAPTKAPTLSPTKAPTLSPTKTPTLAPTKVPTKAPTKSPTKTSCLNNVIGGAETDVDCGGDSGACPRCASGKTCTKGSDCVSTICKGDNTCDTPSPTKAPTKAPTLAPTKAPTLSPTKAPTLAPTKAPTLSPTKAPTLAPTKAPTLSPTKAPTLAPTKVPTKSPTKSPSASPTKAPTLSPTETSCIDKRQGGTETDVDCGGADCGPCAPGKTCAATADCASGVCKADNTCDTPSPTKMPTSAPTVEPFCALWNAKGDANFEEPYWWANYSPATSSGKT